MRKYKVTQMEFSSYSDYGIDLYRDVDYGNRRLHIGNYPKLTKKQRVAFFDGNLYTDANGNLEIRKPA